MDTIHDRAVGIDISKRDAKVCVRLPSARKGQFSSTVTTWASTADAILKLRSFLEQQHVTTVAMEATGDYWKPFYYVVENTLPVLLVNAKNARNIRDEKRMFLTRHGWPNSPLTGSSGHRLCPHHQSGNCVI